MLNRTRVCSILIVLFYTVGLVGFLNPQWVTLFKQLVPFHLLLMATLLMISHLDKSPVFWFTALALGVAGYLIELLGVHTGIIFGEYRYGPTLGIKLLNIPLMIGVNWFILVYSCGVFLSRFSINIYLKSILGGLILVFTDFLIEPVAIKFDYWHWLGAEIPLQNYAAWFIFSFFLFLFFYKIDFEKKNQAASVLLFVQLAFFMVLNLWAL